MKTVITEGLLYVDAAAYDLWLKILIIGVPSAMLIAAAYSLSRNMEDAIAGFGALVFISLLFYFIMPRRYQVYQGTLKIVLGGPFAIAIPFSTIKEVRRTSGFRAFAYSGIRFATSSRYVVEVLRSKGMNYVISPAHGDMFLDQLDRAIRQHRRGK